MDAAAPPPLRIVVVDALDAVLVCLAGELDVEALPLLQAALAPFTGRPVELDLVQVSFIDFSGVNALLVLGDRSLLAGGTTTVVHVSPLVRRVFALAKADGLLPERRDPDVRDDPAH